MADAKTAEIFHTLAVPVDVPLERVQCMLCVALETPHGDWIEFVEIAELADGLTLGDFRRGGSEAIKVDGYFPSTQLIPFVDGCSLSFEVEGEDERRTLDRAAMVKGLGVMAAKYPVHFHDMMQENDDAITADVFLQCCLLGDVIFG